jgi:hypothetical protein
MNRAKWTETCHRLRNEVKRDLKGYTTFESYAPDLSFQELIVEKEFEHRKLLAERDDAEERVRFWKSLALVLAAFIAFCLWMWLDPAGWNRAIHSPPETP